MCDPLRADSEDVSALPTEQDLMLARAITLTSSTCPEHMKPGLEADLRAELVASGKTVADDFDFCREVLCLLDCCSEVPDPYKRIEQLRTAKGLKPLFPR